MSNTFTHDLGFLMCKENIRNDTYVFSNSKVYPFASHSPIKFIIYLHNIKITKIVFICLVDIIECINELFYHNVESWGTSVINFDFLTVYLKLSKILSSVHFVTDWLGVTHILVNNFNLRSAYFSKLHKQWNFQKDIFKKARRKVFALDFFPFILHLST